MEAELEWAVFDQPEKTRDQCLWLRREIQDISLDDTKSREYLDVSEKGTAIDEQTQQQLQGIKDMLENEVCCMHFVPQTLLLRQLSISVKTTLNAVGPLMCYVICDSHIRVDMMAAHVHRYQAPTC